MAGNEERVLAMYDVRGIQKYIYSTSKLKDAMGASTLIDNIIIRALNAACKKIAEQSAVKLDMCNVEIEWIDEAGRVPKQYEHEKACDVQVLYIGGGNAYVSFRDEDLCIEVNQQMAKYVIEKTYSLQLATAYIPMTDNYKVDHEKLFNKMNQVKSNMTITKPLGTLPIMRAELKTGLPVIGLSEFANENGSREMSKETYLKWSTKNDELKEDDIGKILDNYARRGQDSRIAVVHIDGNNMGLRIRKLVEHIENYQEAVTRMRQISYNITYSYLDTFNEMKEIFERKYQDSRVKRFVRKVVVAGDDITYVCNAYIAMETVEWFCQKISQLTMNAETGESASMEIQDADIQEYGFSVCAGIAYIHSHFPFGTAYEVAESCCDNAKAAAKSEENKAYYKVTEPKKYKVISKEEYLRESIAQPVQRTKMGDKKVPSYPYYFEKTGNFFDFQICKNIQCLDLDKVREQEYTTASGEKLLIRPYYIPMLADNDPLNQINAYIEQENLRYDNYEQLKKNIEYFSNQEQFPRSLVKKIRNTYSLGKNQIGLLAAFLDSRNWKMPDGKNCTKNMYLNKGGEVTARWYDVLEIIDYSLNWINIEEGDTINEGKED